MEGSNRVKYIYDLPYKERTIVCKILDLNQKWKELAGNYLSYDVHQIWELERKESPTEVLLSKLGIQNYTITHLFCLLLKMEHHQALLVLEPFVDEKYRKFINKGKENISEFSTSHGAVTSFYSRRRSTLSSTCRTVLSANESVTPVNNGYTEREDTDNNTDALIFPSEAKLKTDILHVDYAELLKATNYWDESIVIGKGGFGIVYKGTWKNTDVAIKKVEKKIEMKLFCRELEFLNSTRHDNILPLYGYSINGDDLCLIYQLMSNGSVENHLHCQNSSKPPLTWQHRHSIAVGTARGLQFLHSHSPPFIHCDIKSANILLDKSFEPRIGDFGLAREGPQGHYTHKTLTRVHETLPYLPHDFLRSKQMSTKVDTYSFGIVLFELATGFRAFNHHKKQFLKDLINEYEEFNVCLLMDKKAGIEDLDTFNSMICIGKRCVMERKNNRPEMVTVLKDLEEIRIKDIRSMQCSPVLQAEENYVNGAIEAELPHELQTEQAEECNFHMPLITELRVK